ncbi:FadR/GntR family transcriptional regulator [Sciscionella sediminilitoris]|uniref:FadR/GntR family transcriptional regulator n=1 Tax=Sciscionella sediminilitoris TaxID=1445613 RepID=UPI0004DF0E02|nr:FadR/GntR family transcriptional regulator [Sciscionella sp. SE31]
MALVTTQRTGLVDQVIEQMRTAVTEGEWPIGERIPTESELVTSLGVGRNTVREAVRALSHSGLLEVRQGDGTYVRATSELSGAMRRLCTDELREALEVRRMIEADGAYHAALRRTEDDVSALRVALRERNATVHGDDETTAVEADFQLHLLIIDCAHNTLLSELYRGLMETMRASVATTFSRTNEYPDDQIMHDALVEAIIARDAERAAREAGGFFEDLLRRHT